jgi:hypothetical protein
MDAIRKIDRVEYGVCDHEERGGRRAFLSWTMTPGVAATMFSGAIARMGAAAENRSQALVEEAGGCRAATPVTVLAVGVRRTVL